MQPQRRLLQIRALPGPRELPWHRILMAAAVALIVARWAWFVTHPWDVDQTAYWSTRDGFPYGVIEWPMKGAYVYSPAFGHAIRPITILPWAAFNAVWMAINIGALVYLSGPVIGAVLLWTYHPVWGDNVLGGNIYILLGLAVALAVRYPAAWSFVVLTKVTPGVGAAWHLGRRAWRSFAVAVGVTLAITAASALLAPQAWADWVLLLADDAGNNPSSVPLAIRLPLALGLAVAAGWRGWLHALPFAVILAMPQVGWSATPVLLAGVYWLRTRGSPLRCQRWSPLALSNLAHAKARRAQGRPVTEQCGRQHWDAQFRSASMHRPEISPEREDPS